MAASKTMPVMTPWKTLALMVGALLLSLTTVSGVLAQGANPCAGPAGAHNPNCHDGACTPGEHGDPVTLANLVTIDPPSTAQGTYQATGAAFGPQPTAAGVAGAVVLVDDGSANPTEGCGPLIGFPAGAIALVDRGTCPFTQKVINAQNAGAIAVIVVNNTGAPITMGGENPDIAIPAVMVSLADGTTIKAGLPATGRVSSNQ